MLRYHVLVCAFFSICVCTGLAYITNTRFKRNVTLDDNKLTGNILSKFRNLSFGSCSRTCASQPLCLRFAYNTNHDCWMYREVFESNEDNIKPAVGWRIFQTEDLILPVKLQLLLIPSTWDEAFTECKNRGMTLAMLSNYITFTAAQKYIKTIPQLKETEGVWIGLIGEENLPFRWIDGDAATGVPWDKDEPSGIGVRCASLHPHRCLIRDNMCNRVQYVLCGG